MPKKVMRRKLRECWIYWHSTRPLDFCFRSPRANPKCPFFVPETPCPTKHFAGRWVLMREVRRHV